MIEKRPPFKANSMKELYKKVVSGKYAPIKNKKVSKSILMLIDLILNPNPRHRPSCSVLINQDLIQNYIRENQLIKDY